MICYENQKNEQYTDAFCYGIGYFLEKGIGMLLVGGMSSCIVGMWFSPEFGWWIHKADIFGQPLEKKLVLDHVTNLRHYSLSEKSRFLFAPVNLPLHLLCLVALSCSLFDTNSDSP